MYVYVFIAYMAALASAKPQRSAERNISHVSAYLENTNKLGQLLVVWECYGTKIETWTSINKWRRVRLKACRNLQFYTGCHSGRANIVNSRITAYQHLRVLGVGRSS